jgi:hypothetical protein
MRAGMRNETCRNFHVSLALARKGKYGIQIDSAYFKLKGPQNYPIKTLGYSGKISRGYLCGKEYAG